MTLCGRWLREGERVPNPGVLVPVPQPKAQPSAAFPAWGYEPKLRVRGLSNAICGLQTGALADEILLEGEGQVKALINIAGNPMMAWPDQLRTWEAMQALELSVTIDSRMTATARLSDYVIAPKLMLETAGISFAAESLGAMGVGWGYTEPYGRYAPPVVDPPAGADLLEDWEFFYGLAQRMGLALQMRCGATFAWPGYPQPAIYELDMQRKPSTDELFEKIAQGSRVPLAEVKRYPRGHLFEDPSIVVWPRDPDCDARLELANDFMMADLEEVSRESLELNSDFTHLLVSRRIPNVFNSVGRDIPRLVRQRTDNPAFMNPEDLQALGLESGDIVEIQSARASILGVVEAAPDLRPGVVSMAHAFGDIPGQDADVRTLGSNTGRLCDARNDYESYTGIPRMSAIPINIKPGKDSTRP
jgi:anaerobic selenocysteine-containing dehydrogenase